MRNSVEHGINSLKWAGRKIAPYAASTFLAVSALIQPAEASAQVQIPPTKPTKHDVYPQCGGQTAPPDETVMVVLSMAGQDVSYNEYSIGKKPGECENPLTFTSSTRAVDIRRSELKSPDVLSQPSIPVQCPEWAVGFDIERAAIVHGIDFEPAAGVFNEPLYPEVRINVHTDLLPNGRYFPSAYLNCLTPEGAALRMPGGLNFALELKP